MQCISDTHYEKKMKVNLLLVVLNRVKNNQIIKFTRLHFFNFKNLTYIFLSSFLDLIVTQKNCKQSWHLRNIKIIKAASSTIPEHPGKLFLNLLLLGLGSGVVSWRRGARRRSCRCQRPRHAVVCHELVHLDSFWS